MKRKIIHVDMDAFYAAIEEQHHPAYKGKPLVVGGRGNPRERGVVSTANYEARKFGIESGMPLRTAFKRCPQAIFLPVDFRKYIEVSSKLKAILREYTLLVESWGLDEAFLDVSGSKRSAVEIAMEIKERIKKELALTGSVGVSHNKLLAKMASSMNKPDGLTVLLGKNVSRMISPLPVSKLLWVGKKTTARLKEMDIETIGDLRKASLSRLREHFGPASSETLYRYSRGIDDSPVVPYHEPKSISHETTFQVDTRNAEVIKDVLLQFAQFLEKELTQRRFKGRTVIVKIRYKSFTTHTRAYTLTEPTRSAETIYQAALKVLDKFDFEREVRLVGLRLSNLRKLK